MSVGSSAAVGSLEEGPQPPPLHILLPGEASDTWTESPLLSPSPVQLLPSFAPRLEAPPLPAALLSAAASATLVEFPPLRKPADTASDGGDVHPMRKDPLGTAPAPGALGAPPGETSQAHGAAPGPQPAGLVWVPWRSVPAPAPPRLSAAERALQACQARVAEDRAAVLEATAAAGVWRARVDAMVASREAADAAFATWRAAAEAEVEALWMRVQACTEARRMARREAAAWQRVAGLPGAGPRHGQPGTGQGVG
jgi:hypothetical protein